MVGNAGQYNAGGDYPNRATYLYGVRIRTNMLKKVIFILLLTAFSFSKANTIDKYTFTHKAHDLTKKKTNEYTVKNIESGCRLVIRINKSNIVMEIYTPSVISKNSRCNINETDDIDEFNLMFIAYH